MLVAFYLSVFCFFGLCLLLCFTILIQESKSLGLGASFGGDVSSSFFGTSTADVLKKFTGYLILFFFVSCLLLSVWSAKVSKISAKAQPTMIEEINA